MQTIHRASLIRGYLLALVVAAGTIAQAATITLNVEFSLFPDNTVLGPTFTLSGYVFKDFPGATHPSFVNVSGSVKGLQFSNAGVRVKLPVRTKGVTISVAAFAGTFNVVAKNAVGGTVTTQNVPGDNAVHTYTLYGPGITSLEFVGGGNEGVIISVAETVTC